MVKRRRPRVVWIPPDRFHRVGTGGLPIDNVSQTGLGSDFITVPSGAGTSSTQIWAVNGDEQLPGVEGLENSLSDITSSAYRLRRVVGKIFCSITQNTEPPGGGASGSVIVTAGLIVLRVGADGLEINPIGEDYSPSRYSGWGDPWIWRRSWILSNFVVALTQDTGAAFPEVNTNFPSALDGPHVDAKTARIIGPEERLFLVVTGTSLGGPSQGGGQPNVVRVTWDLRSLVTMRSSQGNRRNASR